MRRLKAKLFVAVLLAAGLASSAHAQTCNNQILNGLFYGFVTVSATALPFGTYSPASPAPTQGNVVVTAACTGGLLGGKLPPFTVALSAGSGSFSQRLMVSGSYTLQYQIYTSAVLSTVWGDGTGSTSTIGGGNNGSASQTITGYGVMPAGQFATPGMYSDTVTITLSY